MENIQIGKFYGFSYLTSNLSHIHKDKLEIGQLLLNSNPLILSLLVFNNSENDNNGYRPEMAILFWVKYQNLLIKVLKPVFVPIKINFILKTQQIHAPFLSHGSRYSPEKIKMDIASRNIRI